MDSSKIALFASGVFFGGALDHAILAIIGRDVTPYGVRLGVAGNWVLGSIDLVLAYGLYRLHKRTTVRSGDVRDT